MTCGVRAKVGLCLQRSTEGEGDRNPTVPSLLHSVLVARRPGASDMRQDLEVLETLLVGQILSPGEEPAAMKSCVCVRVCICCSI